MKKTSLNFKIIGLIFIALMVVFFIAPSLTTVILVGMLPTVGSFLADRTSMKVHTFCVGCCNIAGLLPIIIELFQHRFSLTTASNVVNNPEKMLIILVCAAVGWGIAIVIPPLTVAYYRTKDRSTLNELTRKYAKLKEAWGEAIPAYDIFKTIQSGGDHPEHSNGQIHLEPLREK